MKKNILCLFLLIVSISVSACQKNGNSSAEQNTNNPEISEENDITNKVVATNSDNLVDGLNLIKSLDFNYGGSEGDVELYTSASVDEDGIPLLDDSNKFLILANIQDKAYPIFETEDVQLGTPEVSVYHDTDADELHIILVDARTASYVVNDFVWDSENDVFIKSDVINYIGGNYWGKLSM